MFDWIFHALIKSTPYIKASMNSILIKLNNVCIILWRKLLWFWSFWKEVNFCHFVYILDCLPLIARERSHSDAIEHLYLYILSSCKKLFGCIRYRIVPQISWQRTGQRTGICILSPIVSIYNIFAFASLLVVAPCLWC